MKLSSYDWVVFDGDDTLWQTTSLYDSAREEFCNWLAEEAAKRELPITALAISAYQQECDKSLYGFMQYSAGRFPRSLEETARHYLKSANATELNRFLLVARRIGESVFAKRAKPYGGAEELLRSLKGRGIQIGLLTAGEAWVQEKRIQEFPWRGLFSWIKIVSDHDRYEVGRSPKEAEIASLKLRYTTSGTRFLLVGDSLTSDIIPAVRADIDALWIAHPNWDREQEHGGEVVAKDVASLKKALASAGLCSSRAFLVERLGDVAKLLELPVAEKGAEPRNPPLFAYGVFEGGGVKGLAYVGGVKACEDRNIEFLGLAGTSSGSIVAGLIAAGYKPDELFGPDGGLLRKADFQEIVGHDVWETGKKIYRVFETLSKSFCCGLVHGAILFPIISKVSKRKGLVDTSGFRAWYNGCLSSKLFPNEPVQEVTFAMIEDAWRKRLGAHLERRPDLAAICAKNGSPLKIVATNVTEKAVIVYPDENTREMVVADAVAASIAIPFVFRPKSILLENVPNDHVDGGALANFPVWSVKNRMGRFGDVVPLLGFRLIGLKENEGHGFLGYLKQLISTVVDGTSRLATRGVDDFYEIALPVSTSTLRIEMSDEEKEETFVQGCEATKAFLFSPRALMLVSQEQMAPKLARIHAEMLTFLGKPDVHLRVNVVARRPPGKQLHVRYSFNMEFDSDDHLEFEEEMAGGAGDCWNKGEQRPIDLKDARATFGEYHMTKGEQALIRRSLTSLLCVPIFDPTDTSELDISRKRMLGVLNFDSDDDLLADFMRKSVMDFADRQAMALALYWIEVGYTGLVNR